MEVVEAKILNILLAGTMRIRSIHSVELRGAFVLNLLVFAIATVSSRLKMH